MVQGGWTTLVTRLPGLSVRAGLDQNAVTGGMMATQRTGLRLELVRAGWLNVPDQDMWWNVTDAVTHTRLWRGRILWIGRTEQDDVNTTGRGGCA